ncbi:MAG: hypothetical protein MN733_27755 [Nitrososphaera sp.]|nr:hypothetical protein [Nitrososphaera sp.]MCI0706876.1 hypothetical protein [Ignavibacteriota bacterium]
MKKIILSSILCIAIVACDEDDLFPDYGPTLPVIAFKGPVTSSDHPEAENIVGWISEFNAFTTSLNIFYDIEPSVSDSTHTWSTVQGGVTNTLTGTLLPGGGYDWKLVLNGKRDDTTTFNNWTAFEGIVDSARRNADWEIYAENTTVKNKDFLWTISSSISLVGTLNVYTGDVITGSVVITDNANDTGVIEIFENGVKRYRAIWTSSGTGYYWYYDENGNVTSESPWQ